MEARGGTQKQRDSTTLDPMVIDKDFGVGSTNWFVGGMYGQG